MKELLSYLEKIVRDDPQKVVCSDCRQKENPYEKVVIMKKVKGYQAEKYTPKQVFHDNLRGEELPAYLFSLAESGFRQMNIWGSKQEYGIRISKKGKVLFQKRKLSAPPKVTVSHNREKHYLLPEGTVIEPLVDMGIFTAEGKVVRSMYDKYRQINKFIELLEDTLQKAKLQKLHIVDFGCGKSYLTFIVYYYLVKVKGIEVQITGLDLKADVIEKCNQAARKYGYEHLRFEVGDINGYQSPTPVDLVMTLHACDTATDFALFNAVNWNAKIILSVPCCQHELCHQMHSETLPILERYGIIKERTAALMTDAVRADLLTACGYRTQVLEFIDLEHTPKNILIRAVKGQVPFEKRGKMLREVRQLTDCFSFEPTLYRLLSEGGQLEKAERFLAAAAAGQKLKEAE